MQGRNRFASIGREYPPVPLVGAAAAVFNDRGEVLLVERGRPPNQGLWGLPGGRVELGETLEEAVHREVREECAVEITLGDVVHIFEPIQRDQSGRIQYHYVVIDYWAAHVSGSPMAGDDAASADWISLERLDKLPMREETRDVVRKAYRQYDVSV